MPGDERCRRAVCGRTACTVRKGAAGPPNTRSNPAAYLTNLDNLSPGELEAEVCALAGQLAAGTCRWLLLVSEVDRRETWGAWGIRSCAHWLSWKCGVSLGTARDHVRVARRLRK